MRFALSKMLRLLQRNNLSAPLNCILLMSDAEQRASLQAGIDARVMA